MANIFNDYFVTVGNRIANSIPPPLSNKYPVAYSIMTQINLLYCMKIFLKRLKLSSTGC